MSAVPPGWASCRLADVTTHKSGNGKLIKGKLHDAPGAGRHPGFSASGADVWCDGWEHEGTAIVVSAVGARCGKAFKADGKWSAIANTHVVWPGSAIERDYLFLQLNDERFWERGGSAQPFVKAGATFQREWLLPPLNEQRRIVAKLDALMARSRRAKDALAAIPQLLEQFRQSILAAAFRGDLTKDWRAKNPDVEPAEELLKRIRIERRRKWEEAELAKMRAKGRVPPDDAWKAKHEVSNPVEASAFADLPAGWCVVELGQVVYRLTNGYVGPTRDIYLDEGVPYLLSKHVKRNVLRFDNQTFVSEAFNVKNRKSILKTGDVLLVQTGHVGDSAVVPPEHEGHNCHAMIVITPVETVLDGEFLSLFFGSPHTQAAFGAIEKGMTLRHLNCHDVIHLPTAVPPLAEQRAIVKRASASLARVDALAAMLASQRDSYLTLERSVLAKAFRGDLVPQDPNDEPASVLLDRLRAASASSPAKPKGTSKARHADPDL